MLPKSDFVFFLHFFLSLPSFCVAVSKLKGEIKSCQRLVSKYEISWRKEKCQIFAFFPLAKSVWPHIGYTAQYEFEKRLRFPSFKPCHALHSGFGKSFWNSFCSHVRGTQKIRTFCCRCFEFATLRCQLQLQWTLLLKSHLHNYPMPFLQIWAEISVMFTLMCIVYAGTGALSWISLGSLPQ